MQSVAEIKKMRKEYPMIGMKRVETENRDNDALFNQLWHKYDSLVRNFASRYAQIGIVGLEYGDLIADARWILLHTIRSHRPEKGGSIFTLFYSSLKNHLGMLSKNRNHQTTWMIYDDQDRLLETCFGKTNLETRLVHYRGDGKRVVCREKVKKHKRAIAEEIRSLYSPVVQIEWGGDPLLYQDTITDPSDCLTLTLAKAISERNGLQERFQDFLYLPPHVFRKKYGLTVFKYSKLKEQYQKIICRAVFDSTMGRVDMSKDVQWCFKKGKRRPCFL